MAKQIRRKSIRTSQNAVTGKLERVLLDPPQLAAERAAGAVEAACCRMPTNAPEQWYAKVRAAIGFLGCAVAGGLMDDPDEPFATIAREWSRLDAAGQYQFAEKLNAMLAAMLPHRS